MNNVSKSVVQELQSSLASGGAASKTIPHTAAALSQARVKSVSDQGICQIPVSEFGAVVAAADKDGILLTVLGPNSGRQAGELEAYNVVLGQLSQPHSVVNDAVDDVDMSMAMASVVARRC